MPGIVGLLTRMPPAQAEAELRRMVEALRHETFYATGTFTDATLGVYVGWVERGDSSSDGMPLWNERGDVGLVFSGEEFSPPGTARRLKQGGHQVDEAGCSYLVHLYEEDDAFPAGLNGRFHGLLMDRARGTATLFNDRYGMHRLYYHESKDAFYFAAEAKAILAVRPELRRPDLRGLGELASCGCVLENRTVFEGIHVLPCAAAWDFRGGVPSSKKTYFHPREWEDQDLLEPEAYYREIREVFSRNLPRYFAGREQIGMSLTGGLDTRMIVAWQKAAPQSLPCYTFGGVVRDNRDVVVSRKVARVCRQPHTVVPVGDEFLSRFSRYAERTVYLSDGCAEVNHSPDLYVNERVREIAPVRMTGNYGGEVLRRVRAFKPVEPMPGLFRPEFDSHIRRAGETYGQLIQGHPLSFAVFRQAPWHHYGLLALEQTQLAVRSPYLDNDFVRTVFRMPVSALTNNDLTLRLIEDGDTRLRKIRTDSGLGGRPGLVSAAITRLFRFLSRAEYAYDYGMPQSLARIDHLLSFCRLERLFLGRNKFSHFRVWYRDGLSQYVREMLLDARTLSRPYLDPRRVEAVVRGHLRGDRNHTIEIHKLLTLELLHRHFFDPHVSGSPFPSA